MKDLASLRGRAIVLMREAIAMLDEAREDLAAVHLQAAIDVAERVPPLRPGDELPDDAAEASPSPDLVADPALVRAIGGALAVFATVMQRSDPVPLGEIARLLGIYAVLSSETCQQEGLILGCWGAILRDAAQIGGEGPRE